MSNVHCHIAHLSRIASWLDIGNIQYIISILFLSLILPYDADKILHREDHVVEYDKPFTIHRVFLPHV